MHSTIINIETKEDGINVANDTCSRDCSGNCDCYMKFKGEEIKIISTEDGIDSNGDIFITGGKIIVYGASSSANRSRWIIDK